MPKICLGFTKYYSVTNMLLLTGLPSFDTLMINARKSDAARWSASNNALVKSLLVDSCVCRFFCVLIVLLCVLSSALLSFFFVPILCILA